MLDIISLAIPALVFASAVHIKGGALGRIAAWHRLTARIKGAYINKLTAVRLGWEAGIFTDKLFWKSLALLPFYAFAKWATDGSIFAVLIVLAYTILTLPALSTALLCTGGFALLLMSVGEEAGAAGDYKGAWGEYITARNPDGSVMFGRSYGIKKGLQYGAFSGGVMALACGSWALWVAGALFPLVYFTGNSLHLAMTGQRSVSDAEPLYGFIIGIAYGLAKAGILST